MAASCVGSNNWTTEEMSTLIAMWSEREVQRIFDGRIKIRSRMNESVTAWKGLALRGAQHRFKQNLKKTYDNR